ncbi:MAG: sulfatase-like hydrolase/transferase [Bacteroidales bacterium]|nr:sulfatase-like hydrolase/transferase [Bacteroidales bacterium]
MRVRSIFMLIGILLISHLITSSYSSPAKDQKINVILIMADDLGYETLGCNGGLSYQTPNLDQMAEEGVRFLNCYSQPLCTPSRVKIMTGKYNYRNYEGFGYLNPDERTFGNVMKDAGYATAVVGKWQLNGVKKHGEKKGEQWPGWDDLDRPHTFGFDEYCLWHFTGSDSRFYNPRIEQNGKLLTGLEEAFGPDIFKNYVLDFIERKKDQPFFIYYPMVLTHSPFVPTPDSKASANKALREKDDIKNFPDMMAYVDKIVGEIKNKVEKEGIADRTLIMFTGDNGTKKNIYSEMLAGTYRGGKGTMLNAGTNVPLIAWWPGNIKEGAVFDELIDFNDFYPTLADLAGHSEANDGQSFLPLLTGKPYHEKEAVFIHYDLRLGPGIHEYHDRFARDKEYKLYEDGRFFHVPTDELEEDSIDTRLTWDVIQIKNMLQEMLDQAPEWQEEF